MVSFIKEFLKDKDYVIQTYGKKQFYIICLKIVFSLIINPILLVIFAIFQLYNLFFIWLLVTIYWVAKVFYGKKISTKIFEWQTRSMMKKLKK